MEKIFKRSFRGFNCDDVVNYIAGLQKEHSEECSELEEKIKSLDAELAKTKEAAAAAESLRAGMEQYKAEIDSLNTTVANLRAELNRNTEMHSRIGDIFVDARAVANQIVDNAKNEAGAISTETKHCADISIGEIDAAYSDLRRLQSDINRIMDAFSKHLDEMSASLDGAKLRIKAYSSDPDEKSDASFIDAPSIFNIQSSQDRRDDNFSTMDNVKYL